MQAILRGVVVSLVGEGWGTFVVLAVSFGGDGDIDVDADGVSGQEIGIAGTMSLGV